MSKHLLLIGFFLFFFSVSAQQIRWTTMNNALLLQKEKPKKIMVFFYAEWSKDSHKMNETTLVNKDVARYINKHFYAVNFNGEGTENVNYKGFEYANPNYDQNREGRNYQHFFADALKITTYPTILFFDENGEIISPVVGFKSTRDIEIFLKMVATDNYKNITTAEAWKDYQKTFKPKFRVN
jgi:thioredoxin-related protein